MEPLKGLITAPNTLQTDPYSVITADDVVVDIGGYLRTREGQKEILNISENSPVSTITNVGTDYYYFMENGTIYRNSSQIGSGYTVPDVKTGVQSLSIGNMVYANVLESNYQTQQQLGGGVKISGTNIGKQGVPRPVIAAYSNGTAYTNYEDWAIENTLETRGSDFISLQNNSYAYCCTIEYIDDNGRLVESEPSNILTRTLYNLWMYDTFPTPDITKNNIQTNFNKFKIYCYDSNVIDVNRKYTLNIYRTEIYQNNSGSIPTTGSIETEERRKRCNSLINNDRIFYLLTKIDSSTFSSSTSGGVTSYYYDYDEKLKSTAFGKTPLYSNSDATLQNANSQLHKIFGKFKEYYIYANVREKQIINIQLNSPWGSGSSYSTDIFTNNLIINSNSYNFAVTSMNYNIVWTSKTYTFFIDKVYSSTGNNSYIGTNLYNEMGLISNAVDISYIGVFRNEISLLNNLLFNNPQYANSIPFLTAQKLNLESKDFRIANTTVSRTNSAFIDSWTISPQLYKNKLYYSKFQEPDSIPRLNFLDVGDGSEILGVKQLRQSLFIFKENDGVYILRGNGPEDWSLLRLYPDLRLVAPRTLVVMEDSIIGLFNLGIMAVSENGYEPLSKDIKDVIEPFTRSATPEKQWAVDDKTNRRYYAFIDVGTNGSKPFVFDFYTNSWTRFTYERNAGVYANGKLITTLLEGGVNKIYEQEQGKYVDTNLLGVETKINSTIEFRKFVGDQFALSKVFKDMVLFFRNNNFNSLKISYLTNLTNSYYTYSISLIKNLTYVLGNVIRSLVPREYSRGNWLGVKIATDPTVAVVDKTKPEFALEGVEVFFNKTTNKT